MSLISRIDLNAFVTDVRLQNLFVLKEKGSRGNNETEIKAHIVYDMKIVGISLEIELI